MYVIVALSTTRPCSGNIIQVDPTLSANNSNFVLLVYAHAHVVGIEGASPSHCASPLSQS